MRDLEDVTEPLTNEEEAELIPKARAGDEAAMARVVAANLRFVRLTLNQHHYQDYCGHVIDPEDIESAGVCGLLRAVRTWDEKRGLRFITYAVWWINAAMMNELQHHNVLRQSAQVTTRISTYFRKQNEHFELHGTYRDSDDVFDEIGANDDARERLAWLMQPPVALDAPLTRMDRDSGSWGAVIADNSNPDEDEHLDGISARAQVEFLTQCLSARDREMMFKRFGMDGQPEMNGPQLAALYGCSRQRIDQVQDRSLQAMRQRARTTRAVRKLRANMHHRTADEEETDG